VAPKVAGQLMQLNADYDIYFANSFPRGLNPDWCQKEASYEVRYNASFPVMGGGTINFVIHDSNCRTLANCGAVENQPSCDTSAARTIDMSGVTPAPVNFTQPRTGSLGGTTYYLQWLWLDVTSVTSP
jgi:CDGSH-type Zn-finger protein